MPHSVSGRVAALRLSIERFLQERLDAKLKPLKPDDPKRQELPARYVPQVWIPDAARCARQIQRVTHVLKATHPDALGTSLYTPPPTLPQHPLVGSHCLGDDFTEDVTGNAPALYVYQFLRVEHDGCSLLALLQAGDADLLAAFSDDPVEAQAWAEAFIGITQAGEKPASHTLAKQVYWHVGGDPSDDEAYHLLAPLRASSLAHAVHATITEHRFGDEAKQARQARRDGVYSDTVLHEYPQIAVQKLGGTNPQNISQLNSERRGMNYLLAGLPPRWETSELPLPLRTTDAMRSFGRLREVRRLVRELAAFLKAGPRSIMSTRDSRDVWTDTLVDELLHYAHSLALLHPPGWSADERCELPEHQRLWLDPYRAVEDDEFSRAWHRKDWMEQVYEDFAQWLNGRLTALAGLPVGDPESRHWAQGFEDEQELRWQTDQFRRRIAKLQALKGGLDGDR
ncbi:type I-F CRISPR-associated protein Csy1 [Pseudorhodoferax sp.]|uniref:type I-F CRISPR-associated protein Csy1 n=1 Tax=Pseudorhodoferax sp. TaxID=1993553 RepID=UPI0039E28EA8